MEQIHTNPKSPATSWGSCHSHIIKTRNSKLRDDVLKRIMHAEHQWFMPVVLDAWEAEIQRISIQGK
jgi:hypothetical protein